MRFTKLLLQLCTAAVLLAPSFSIAGMPGTRNCGFDDYDNCIRFECGGDGGPYGETPCCKPPPYYPQLCKQAELYLPTTVVYAAPESVYGPQSETGYASQNHVVGNYVIIALNPMWMASFGYGYSQCGMPVPIDAGAIANDAIRAKEGVVDSSEDTPDWKTDIDGGSLWLNRDGLDKAYVPTSKRSQVDNRLWATAWTFARRGAEYQDVPWTAATKVSVSPYTDNCRNMSDATAMPKLFEEYGDTATEHYSYTTFGNYLKRYKNQDFDDLIDELDGITGHGLGAANMSDIFGNNVFDDECNDSAKPWPETDSKRPMFFLWNKYRISIHKGQVTDCI